MDRPCQSEEPFDARIETAGDLIAMTNLQDETETRFRRIDDFSPDAREQYYLMTDAYEHGSETTLLSMHRDGTAFLTLHAGGYRASTETRLGRCERMN